MLRHNNSLVESVLSIVFVACQTAQHRLSFNSIYCKSEDQFDYPLNITVHDSYCCATWSQLTGLVVAIIVILITWAQRPYRTKMQPQTGSTYILTLKTKKWPIVVCRDEVVPVEFMRYRQDHSYTPAILLGKRKL